MRVCVGGGGRKQRLGCKTSCSVFHSGLCVAWVGNSFRFISRVKNVFVSRIFSVLSRPVASWSVCKLTELTSTRVLEGKFSSLDNLSKLVTIYLAPHTMPHDASIISRNFK